MGHHYRKGTPYFVLHRPVLESGVQILEKLPNLDE